MAPWLDGDNSDIFWYRALDFDINYLFKRTLFQIVSVFSQGSHESLCPIDCHVCLALLENAGLNCEFFLRCIARSSRLAAAKRAEVVAKSCACIFWELCQLDPEKQLLSLHDFSGCPKRIRLEAGLTEGVWVSQNSSPSWKEVCFGAALWKEHESDLEWLQMRSIFAEITVYFSVFHHFTFFHSVFPKTAPWTRLKASHPRLSKGRYEKTRPSKGKNRALVFLFVSSGLFSAALRLAATYRCGSWLFSNWWCFWNILQHVFETRFEDVWRFFKVLYMFFLLIFICIYYIISW